ncbi:unnamed protein product [Musa acuminata var. zebrina]
MGKRNPKRTTTTPIFFTSCKIKKRLGDWVSNQKGWTKLWGSVLISVHFFLGQ